MKDEEVVKVSLNLPVDLLEKAKEFAAAKGWSFTDVVRQGLADTMYLKNERDKGSRILLVRPDGSAGEIIWRG